MEVMTGLPTVVMASGGAHSDDSAAGACNSHEEPFVEGDIATSSSGGNEMGTEEVNLSYFKESKLVRPLKV